MDRGRCCGVRLMRAASTKPELHSFQHVITHAALQPAAAAFVLRFNRGVTAGMTLPISAQHIHEK
jgi:hypothetical protein